MNGVPVAAACNAPRRDVPFRSASLFIALAAVAALVLLSHACGIVLCPMKRLLGVPCPSCGTTRAFILALRGDFLGAFTLQPLGMAIVLGAGPLALAAARHPRCRQMLTSAFRRPWAWLLSAIAVAANWIYVAYIGN